ncbi:MAG: NeuD/PglB/VioB family sugar acetyltransferase [Chloroflexi bacterium]|nr:NeuD/PglB/VioB family sugar acetyltransferase [Chloroflexota bacterium]
MSEVRRVIILGLAGNAVDVLDIVHEVNATSPSSRYVCVGILDDDRALWGRDVHGVAVLGPLESARDHPQCYFVNCIGSPSNFWKKDAIIAKSGVPLERFATLVHPRASVSHLAQLGAGAVVFANATVSATARVGNHVFVRPNAVVSHDNVIGDYTIVASGVCLAGGVRVGRLCFLGLNSTVVGNVTIGEYCLVGMGGLVRADVPPHSFVVGQPARLVGHIPPG